jgi:hypothetical protein
MKLIKLNRRYRAYKEYGHTWGFRFDRWTPEHCGSIERLLESMYGSQYNGNKHGLYNHWRGTFGTKIPFNTHYRPYFITFRDESVISVVLLKLEMQ